MEIEKPNKMKQRNVQKKQVQPKSKNFKKEVRNVKTKVIKKGK